MRVLLVQGTWGYNDYWWHRQNEGSFATAIIDAGHTLVDGGDTLRPFQWDTDLGGIGFGSEDLRGWKGAGRHLHDYLQPPTAPACWVPTDDLVIVAHSHGRQVVRFALQAGLKAHTLILVSGPVRKDVDERTPDAYDRVQHVVQLNGGRRDRFQWYGELFDGHWGIRRADDRAHYHCTYPDANHNSLLTDPTQFERILRHIRA